MKTKIHIQTLPLLFFCLLLFTYSSQLLGQEAGDIRGFVYEKSTGEPVIFANVYLEGTTRGAVTDVEGFYTITKVPVGEYLLTTTTLGYDTSRVEIEVLKNQIINQKVFLKEADMLLETFEFGTEREAKTNDVRIGTIKITAKEINKIPAVGGEPDLAQYLQILPGVVFTGDQGGQLYIRGGSQVQTKVLIDGLTIYNPFHSVGLFSVFETDLIRNVEVKTGGFGGEYGGRISAVIDVTTRDGNKSRLAGKVSANTFLTKAVLEGPFIKQSEDGVSGSFVLAGKTSYLDRSSKVLYSYVDTAGLPYNFTDLYGKATITTGNGSKFSFTGFRYTDNADYQGSSLFQWGSWGLGSRFVVVPAQSKTIIDGYFSFSTYDIELTEADERPRTSSIGGFNGGVNFSYFLPNGEVTYGVEVSGFSTTFDFFNGLGFKIEQDQNTTELGGFLKYKLNFNQKLIVEPSVRINYYGSLSEFSLEPRFGLKYNLSKRFRIKASGGIYTQNFISTKSDRDVVNLFTGFLSAPDDGNITNPDGEKVDVALQRSVHAIGGVEVDLTRHLSLNVESYYKGFPQLVNINRNKLFGTDPNYVVESGAAYGFDILAKYDFKRWFVWGVYSLGWVTRRDAEQTYPPHFDRRHNLNFLGSYSFGEDLGWEVSLRWNYGSAFPFTRTQGFYEENDLQEGVDANIMEQNGALGILYEYKLNAGRMSDYHRLDLSIKKDWTIGPNSKINASASITNIYNRENVFYVDRVRGTRVNQLPLLPSMGIGFSF